MTQSFPSGEQPAAASPELTPVDAPSDVSRRRLLLLAGLTVVALVAGLAVAVTALGGDGDSELTAPLPRRPRPVASATASAAPGVGAPRAGTARTAAVTTRPAAPRARVARPVAPRDPFRPLVVPCRRRHAGPGASRLFRGLLWGLLRRHGHRDGHVRLVRWRDRRVRCRGRVHERRRAPLTPPGWPATG
ncbi:MAG TPA: hypothetical protein VKP64_05895 [Mycobacteriales bacterium]|nr:hypothetical protein [Mycobacteriales bacterium]